MTSFQSRWKFIFSWPRVYPRHKNFVKCDTSIYEDTLYNHEQKLPGNKNLVSQPCLCLLENTEKKQNPNSKKSNENSGKQTKKAHKKHISVKFKMYKMFPFISKQYGVRKHYKCKINKSYILYKFLNSILRDKD